MKFKQQKHDFLKHAKGRGFCFSENYCVFCTGRRAFICDKKLNLLHTVENLSYAYCAYISPDETKLLLVSNGNVFYLVDLQDFSVRKQTVRGKYHENLEGRGCWSLDGGSVYMCVCDRNSALRRYDLHDLAYEDLLAEKYYLVSVKPVKELHNYLLVGFDREKYGADQMDCWCLIWFDGTSFVEYPIWNAQVSNDSVFSAAYEAETNTVLLYGYSKTFRCDLQGNVIADLSFARSEKVEASFSDLPANPNLHFERDELIALEKISASLGMENVALDDSIYASCLSSDGKRYYLGTHSGIIVRDADTKEVLGRKKIEYGVQNIAELSPHIIAIATWGGVKVFEIVE